MTAGGDRAGGSGSVPTGVLGAASTLPDSDYPDPARRTLRHREGALTRPPRLSGSLLGILADFRRAGVWFISWPVWFFQWGGWFFMGFKNPRQRETTGRRGKGPEWL